MTETPTTNTAPEGNSYDDMLIVQAALRGYAAHLSGMADRAKARHDHIYADALRVDAARAVELEKAVNLDTAEQLRAAVTR